MRYIDVLKYARADNTYIFQLPPHSSHSTKPLDVSAFIIFKRQLTDSPTKFPQTKRVRFPANSDIACIVHDSWETVFGSQTISASFAVAGIFPVTRRG